MALYKLYYLLITYYKQQLLHNLPHWFINFWHDDVCWGGLFGDTRVRISYADQTKSQLNNSTMMLVQLWNSYFHTSLFLTSHLPVWKAVQPILTDTLEEAFYNCTLHHKLDHKSI